MHSYGYADVKIWNRSLNFVPKFARDYGALQIEQKESYKWIEVSKNTQESLSDIVAGMIILQDREGDIYDQFCCIPDEKTDLRIRSSADRKLADKSKLFDSLSGQTSQGHFEILIYAKDGRPRRKAKIAVRFKDVLIKTPEKANKSLPKSIALYFIEAQEVDYKVKDGIC